MNTGDKVLHLYGTLTLGEVTNPRPTYKGKQDRNAVRVAFKRGGKIVHRTILKKSVKKV